MKIDLDSFEQQIDKIILQRGQRAFEDGVVQNLEAIGSGMWFAQVAGTEIYEVELKISKNRVKQYRCNCPYDLGPVCKHVVAVLYSLQKERTAPKTGKEKIKQDNSPSKKQMIQQILDNVNYRELKVFILEQALKKNEFGNMLLARFADQTGLEDKAKYVLIIKSAVQSATDRSGFIENKNTSKLLKPVQELLNQAEKALSQKYYAQVVSICQAVIEEIIPLTRDLDDSNGKAGDAIATAFMLLEQMSEGPVPMPLQDNLFEYALAQAPQDKYQQFDFLDNWLHLLDKLAKDNIREAKVVELVQTLLFNLQKNKKAPPVKNDILLSQVFMTIFPDAVKYDEQRLIYFLANFYQSRNRKQEAHEIISTYNYLPEFREILIREALANQDYAAARQQTREALAYDEKNRFAGLVIKWEEWLLRIAEAENNIIDLRQQAEKLFMQTSRIEFYRKLKQTYVANAWQTVYEQLIDKMLKKDKSYWFGIERIVPVYIEEKDWAKLFKFVRQHPELDLLLLVSKYLQKDYGPPLLELFTNAVFQYADRNVDRSSYRTVTKTLQHMLTLENGKPVVQQLIADFREIFKKRRAMMDELAKIKIA